MRAALRDPARRAKVSESAKTQWADPLVREKMLAGMKASNADPVVRQKKASATRKQWADPAVRKKLIAAMRGKPKRRKNRDTADC